MSDLHEAHDQERGPQNDTASWLLWAIGVAIIAAATMAAYKAHDTTVANAPVLQKVVTR
jgi:hypothetical protein